MIISRVIILLLLSFFAFTSCKKDDDEDPLNDIDNENFDNLNNKSVGASAAELLSDDTYKHLVFELQYTEGFAPTSESVTNLKSFLQERLHKSSVTLQQKEISYNKNIYSVSDLVEVEDLHRKAYTGEDTIGVYLLITGGEYSENTENSKVLGVAYRNTSMALFGQTINDFSGGLGEPQRKTLETVVMQHEVGHILGLVNNGSDMQDPHQDEGHGHHCDNDNCLMYYAAETGDMVSKLITGGAVPSLDENCIQDLQAMGGK